ncbi:phage tail tape measure protein [Clostridium sp. Marseille-QA1073]
MAGFKGYRRSIVLDFNYDSVKTGVSGTSKQMALLNSEFRKQMEQAGKTGNALDKLGLRYDHAVNKMNIQKEKVDALRKQLEQLTNAETKNAKAITNKTIELNNAEAALSRMEDEVKDLTGELERQNTTFGQAQAKMQDFVASAEEVGINLDEVGSKFQKVGAIMMSIGLIGGKLANDFDKSMAKARTIMDESQMSFKDANKAVLQLSSDMNMLNTDVAEGFYQTLSSGVQTKDAFVVLTEATRLAKAGFTDTATSVDLLTTILNSYGLSMKQAKVLTDQLVKTQEVGKIEIGELGEQFGRVAGLAATAEIPIEQLLGAIATLTQSGIDSSQAITGLRGVLSAVISPTAEATEEAKKLGLNFSLSALRAKGFSGFLEDVEKKTRGNSESIGKLFGNINALNGMFVLTGKGADMYVDATNKIANSTGFAQSALEKLETPGEKVEKAFNKLVNTLTEVGKFLSPLLYILAGFIELLSAIPAPILAVVAIAGALSIVVGTIAKAITSVSKVTNLMNTAFGGVNITLAKTALIIMGVAAAIAVVLALINSLLGKAPDVERSMNSMMGVLGNKQQQMQQGVQRQSQNAYSGVQGSYATGIKRVPRDRMKVEVHKDEAIIPASQNPYINGNGSFGGGDVINITIDAKNVAEFNSVVRMAKEYKQTARSYGRG